MKAIILAAGRGSRMGHITSNIPKCLIKIQNKALIDWQLDAFRKNQIKDICLITGYKNSSFKNYDLYQLYNRYWKTTNMIDSLIYADDWLKKYECIVSYSDIFYPSHIIKSLANSKEDLSITYDVNWRSLWLKRFKKPLEDAESFKLSKNNYIIEIGKKSSSLDEIEGQYMGLLKFNPNCWKIFKKNYERMDLIDKQTMSVTLFLNYLIEKSVIKVKGIPFKGKWGEVDTIKDLKLYNMET